MGLRRLRRGCRLSIVEELRIETVSDATDGLRILRLSGPFTLKTLFEFQNLVRSGDAPATIIDLTEVPYIDSAALGCLMGVHVSAQRMKRPYALVGAAPRIKTLFETVAVDKILVTYDTADEAKEALLGKAKSA